MYTCSILRLGDPRGTEDHNTKNSSCLWNIVISQSFCYILCISIKGEVKCPGLIALTRLGGAPLHGPKTQYQNYFRVNSVYGSMKKNCGNRNKYLTGLWDCL
jgi:hypothetical protein